MMKRFPVLLLVVSSACAPASLPSAPLYPAPQQAPRPEPATITTSAPPELAPWPSPRGPRLTRAPSVWCVSASFGGACGSSTLRSSRARSDWDAALVAALPRALAAQNDDEEAAAARALLEVLHEPATRVEKGPTDPPPDSTPAAPPLTHTVDGVVVVPVTLTNGSAIEPTTWRIEKDLANAKLAVIDLRGAAGNDFTDLLFNSIGFHLAPHPATGLASRIVEHHGYHQQAGTTSGAYSTWLAAQLPTVYPVAPKLRTAAPRFPGRTPRPACPTSRGRCSALATRRSSYRARFPPARSWVPTTCSSAADGSRTCGGRSWWARCRNPTCSCQPARRTKPSSPPRCVPPSTRRRRNRL